VKTSGEVAVFGKMPFYNISGGKEPIESGMFSDGSDTIVGHLPVQRTQLRS